MNAKEAFERISETNYEKENNIKIIEKEIILDCEDIKLVKVNKSTGEIGLCILFNASVKQETWFLWYPSKNQMEKLPTIALILSDIDKFNGNFWKK